MKSHIAVLTSRIELWQTFFFQDIELLSNNYSVTVFALFPPRNKKKIVQILKKEICTEWVTSFQFLIYLPVASIIYLYKYPKQFTRTLKKIFILYWFRPKLFIINIILLFLTIACALIMLRKNVCHIHAYWATYSATSAMLASILTDIPFSFSIHAHDLLEDPYALNNKLNSALSVLFCSEWARTRLKNIIGLPEKNYNKLVLCHHGIDPEKYMHYTENIRRSPYLSIVSIGRIVPKKGFEILIRAISIIARQLPVRCTICGPILDHSYYSLLRKEIDNCYGNAKIYLTGYVSRDKIVSILQKCSLYVQPSIIDGKSGDSDGIPNALLEAMALGVPVVATSIGGIPEVITNGVTGILVEPANPVALAEAILQLYNNWSQSLYPLEQCRQLLMEKFNLNKRLNLFTEIIGEGKQNSDCS